MKWATQGRSAPCWQWWLIPPFSDQPAQPEFFLTLSLLSEGDLVWLGNLWALPKHWY